MNSDIKLFINKLKNNNVSPDLLNGFLTTIKKIKSQKEKRESIAIVGIGCKLPANINTTDDLWRVLLNGQSGITDYPKNRGWDINDFYSADKDTRGKTYVNQGGFINDIDLFDPSFFGISPNEAIQMDPQQRLILETTYKAIENGGLSLKDLQNRKTGVFIGVGTSDYRSLSVNKDSLDNINFYSGTGNSRGVAAGRISYLMSFNGPSLTVDTACSSSMTALHLGINSLLLKESDCALIGGVNLILTPQEVISRCALGALSDDASCKSFDENANGFALGEGCGVIVLKRLQDAVRDKDNIQAVICGSAINHNGGGNGMTAPNGKSQETVINNCLNVGEVDPEKVDYIEAHGPGTSLGDPIEYYSLANTYCTNNNRKSKLYLGALKANFGHAEAASGILSIIKAALIAKNKTIPPQVNYHTPNSQIDWNQYPIEVPIEVKDLKEKKEEVYVGVSSFGIGGSNAHVVIKTPLVENKENTSSKDELYGLILGAHKENNIEAQVNSMLKFLEYTEESVKNICYTQAIKGKTFNYRIGVVGKTKKELAKRLHAFLEGKKKLGLFNYLGNNKASKLTFVFSGHGSQGKKIGSWMFKHYPVFRSVIDECQEAYYQISGNDLKKNMFEASEEALESAQTAHPVIFSFGIAFAKQLMHWGVTPDSLIGHSIGEYTGICLAGILDIKSTLQLIEKRASLMESVGDEGRMLAIIAKEAHVKQVIKENGADVDFAAINGKEAIVISGHLEELEKVEKAFKEQQISVNYLSVSHAAHSRFMNPIMAEFTEYARNVKINKPKLDIVSNIKGEFITDKEITEQYWANHLRDTVRFQKGVNTILDRGVNCFLEIGFKAALTPLIRESNPDTTTISISQPGFERTALLTALTNLSSYGINVNWEEVLKPFSCEKIEIPAYTFNRSRFWFADTNNTKFNTSAKILPHKSIENIYTDIFEESFEKNKELTLADKDPISIVRFRNRIKQELGISITLKTIGESNLQEIAAICKSNTK
ncbi:type I polyketide synthase [Tenacibaculum tangerinum]|uniref:Type I polyketide synthase n=1 Tax=Tenacibaculum tangerinum TaxID=3038772 RepID=A0ABY8L206_9FLAO|nr:type I polyketide synthase [Tenacibaculum tangerinum]WGH74233.1 type I polyketide synthase [Tenacibaculum tangerinum]